MRQGVSPAKHAGLPAHTPAEVGVTSLVFIPSLTGFYAHALDMLDLHLSSLRKTLPQGEILVWDNGSCAEVVRFLEQRFRAGQLGYLMLSRYNLGKAGVLNWILAAMPHRYITFTDGDIFFFDGWWKAVQEVFQAFPRAGMVSPAPAFFDVMRGESRTAAMLTQAGFRVSEDAPTLKDAQLYYRGLGYKMPETLPILPFATASDGTRVCARSGHHVFVMPQEVARSVPPLPVDRALSSQSDRVLHERVEAQGYWQLSTAQTFVYHLGNTSSLPPELAEEGQRLSEVGSAARRSAPVAALQRPRGVKGVIREGIRRAAQRSPWLRRKIERLYDALFRLLYGEV